MSELEVRLHRFAHEWHEAMNSPHAVNMMPMLLEAASDVRRLVAPSLDAENAKLREYVAKLEMANIDVTARLTDYIGQYDPTDAFVAEVKADNAKLQDENARLRSCLSDDAENARQIMAENAKLRELVRDMWFWGYEGHMGSESQDWQMKHIDGVLDRMRELGVEVD